jgi:hypothetical protein
MSRRNLLDDFLKFHKRSCTFFLFSGDRRCSCGRDAALAELAALRNTCTCARCKCLVSVGSSAGGQDFLVFDIVPEEGQDC